MFKKRYTHLNSVISQTGLQVGKKLSELIRDSGSQILGTEQGRWQAELSQVAIELISVSIFICMLYEYASLYFHFSLHFIERELSVPISMVLNYVYMHAVCLCFMELNDKKKPSI